MGTLIHYWIKYILFFSHALIIYIYIYDLDLDYILICSVEASDQFLKQS